MVAGGQQLQQRGQREVIVKPSAVEDWIDVPECSFTDRDMRECLIVAPPVSACSGCCFRARPFAQYPALSLSCVSGLREVVRALSLIAGCEARTSREPRPQMQLCCMTASSLSLSVFASLSPHRVWRRVHSVHVATPLEFASRCANACREESLRPSYYCWHVPLVLIASRAPVTRFVQHRSSRSLLPGRVHVLFKVLRGAPKEGMRTSSSVDSALSALFGPSGYRFVYRFPWGGAEQSVRAACGDISHGPPQLLVRVMSFGADRPADLHLVRRAHPRDVRARGRLRHPDAHPRRPRRPRHGPPLCARPCPTRAAPRAHTCARSLANPLRVFWLRASREFAQELASTERASSRAEPFGRWAHIAQHGDPARISAGGGYSRRRLGGGLDRAGRRFIGTEDVGVVTYIGTSPDRNLKPVPFMEALGRRGVGRYRFGAGGAVDASMARGSGSVDLALLDDEFLLVGSPATWGSFSQVSRFCHAVERKAGAHVVHVAPQVCVSGSMTSFAHRLLCRPESAHRPYRARARPSFSSAA